MIAPDGAQFSDDGNYWWDGETWQPVTGTSGDGSSGDAGVETGTRSEDGNYWWDGIAWQPVEAEALASAAVGPEQPMDWSQFPEIARVLHYGEDIDVYLADLGVDPNIMCDDEPFANA